MPALFARHFQEPVCCRVNLRKIPSRCLVWCFLLLSPTACDKRRSSTKNSKHFEPVRAALCNNPLGLVSVQQRASVGSSIWPRLWFYLHAKYLVTNCKYIGPSNCLCDESFRRNLGRFHLHRLASIPESFPSSSMASLRPQPPPRQ